MVGSEWATGIPIKRLTKDEVHVWLLDLSNNQQELLSTDERNRAMRLRNKDERRRFSAARNQLRVIIGGYLEESPYNLSFSYGPYGKPFLPAFPHLQFNLSHSADKAVLAVCLERQVGIDITCTTNSQIIDPGMEKLALTENELRRLMNLSYQQRRLEFLKMWTLKESYLKAVGSGLSVPPNEIELLAGNDNILVLQAVPEPLSATKVWSSSNLPAIAEYTGSLVAEGRGWQLRPYRLSRYLHTVFALPDHGKNIVNIT